MGDNPTSAGNQQERLSSEETRRWFLAGVIEGEGSVCISIKAHPTTAFGYYVQPCLFVYQHRARRELLELAKEVFQAGTIYAKPGNPDVLVFGINSRRTISTQVVPFLAKYMRFSARWADFGRFIEAVQLLDQRAHRKPEGLARVVRLAYGMSMDGKQRKRPLEQVLDRILRGHTPDVPVAGGEEMVRSPRRRGEPGGNGNDLAPSLSGLRSNTNA